MGLDGVGSRPATGAGFSAASGGGFELGVEGLSGCDEFCEARLGFGWFGWGYLVLRFGHTGRAG